MYFVDNFNPVFQCEDSARSQVWVELMSAQERDWARVYQEFSPQLSRYIQAVCLNSLSSDKAKEELKQLGTFFSWNESYSRVWEIDVAVDPVEVDYSSLEEMLQSEEYGSEPEESAYNSWNSASGDLDISWGSSYPPKVSITSLQLR